MVYFKMSETQLVNLEKYVQELPTKHGMPIIEFLRQVERVEEKPVETPKKEVPKEKKKIKSVTNKKWEDKKTTVK